MSLFDFDRYYASDDSFPGHFAVYEHDLFVCTGLTLDQAKDFIHGADLIDMNIQQLCF